MYRYLKSHPDIYMSPVKETSFFAFGGENPTRYEPNDQKWISNSITEWDQYYPQFEGVQSETAIGEASPMYLYHPRASERIYENVPEAKLIVILRNPIPGAYSDYLMHVRYGRDTRTFLQALQEDTAHHRYQIGSYARKGGYYE